MRRLFLLIVIVSQFMDAGNISGYVASLVSGETLIMANLILDGTTKGASTDINGFFIIRDVKSGRYTLTVSHIGYSNVTRKIEIDDNNIYFKRINLKPQVLQGAPINVSGYRSKIIKKDMDIASVEIDPIVLKKAPQLSKDVFKLIKLTPAVTISDPMSPLFYVRGSDPSENLIQLGGMTIYNPQHIWGMEAIFNPYAIKNIEMLVGGFGAEFGGRNSSILYITSREGHNKKVKGEFKPSTSGVQGAIEFPVLKNGSAMFSGRIMSSLISTVFMSMPNKMIDFNGTYLVHLNNTRIRFSTFYANDYIDFDIKRLTKYFNMPFEDYSIGWLTNTNNFASGIQTRTNISPALIAESQIYYSTFNVSNKTFFTLKIPDEEQDVDIQLDYETLIKNEIKDITIKGNLSWYAFYNQIFKIGFEYNDYTFYNNLGTSSAQNTTSLQKSKLQSVFLQDRIEIGAWRFKAGIRASNFTAHNAWRYEPRTSLAFDLGTVTLKGAWGKYNQYITAMNTQDYEMSQFLDYYYPLQNTEPIKSEHFILGIEGALFNNLDFSISTYYKDLPVLYRFDYNNDINSVLSYNASLEKGSGEAYGVEILLRGQISSLSGWVSYSWSRSTRSYPSIQNGKEFLYDGDQSHNLKSLLMYDLTRHFTISSSFQLTSGYPKTWETGSINHYSYNPVNNSYGTFPEYITPVKNNVRFPWRLILDIGWRKKLRDGFGYNLAEYLGADTAYLNMSLQNLLFLHRNPYMYMYIPDFGYYGFDFNFIPNVSIGYNIEF